MPHTQDRAAASKAQERLERCQQRQPIDGERTAKAKTGIGLAACVLPLPWPKSVCVGLCFWVTVSISISLSASLFLAFGLPAFSLTCLPFLDAWFLLLFFFPLCLFPFNPLSLLLLSVSIFSLFLQYRSLCLATRTKRAGCVERFGGQVCGKRTVVVVLPCRL